MKKLFCLFIFALTFLAGISCTSIKTTQRDTLLKDEQWRYQLPLEESQVEAPVFPKADTMELKNGLKIFLLEDHRLPIAEVHLVFKGGSSLDPAGKSGLSFLTTQMLKEGTKELDSLQLHEAFADMGSELLANTTKDMSHLHAGVLSGKVDEVLHLMSQIVQAPRFAEEDFSRVKTRLENSIAADQGVPTYAAQVSFLKAAYGEKHPYAFPTKGTIKTVQGLNLNDIKRAHGNFFGPNHAALVVVGDVNKEALRKIAEEKFSSWPKVKSGLTKIAKPSERKTLETRLVARENTPQTLLLLGQPLADAKDKDLAAFNVLMQILSSSPSSRLDANLREAKGWTYGVSSMVNPMVGLGPMMIITSIQVPYASDALDEMLKEFSKLEEEKISDEELLSAKNGLSLSFGSRFNTLGKIAESFIGGFVYDLEPDYEKNYYENLSKVSATDIQNVAKRAFKRENLVVVAVGDPEIMQLPLAAKKLGKVVVEKEDS